MKKIYIEIEFNPNKTALESFNNNEQAIIDSDIEKTLNNLIHNLDGFDIKKHQVIGLWTGTIITTRSE